ncbi:hypothetical protein PMAYCL1PPCAC_07395, partial [Pristionchus mayeri]
FSPTASGPFLFPLLTPTRMTMTTPNYHQLLIDAFNQHRINVICTSAFSSWTIFTEADDEFLEECAHTVTTVIELPHPLRHECIPLVDSYL